MIRQCELIGLFRSSFTTNQRQNHRKI